VVIPVEKKRELEQSLEKLKQRIDSLAQREDS
jgi:hypothetical protein